MKKDPMAALIEGMLERSRILVVHVTRIGESTSKPVEVWPIRESIISHRMMRDLADDHMRRNSEHRPSFLGRRG
jgi:hypothetical protein